MEKSKEEDKNVSPAAEQNPAPTATAPVPADEEEPQPGEDDEHHPPAKARGLVCKALFMLACVISLMPAGYTKHHLTLNPKP